ncbi:MAG: 3-phosphoshikimate 1-carboxyvinyltransferase [Ruminococcus sp.]|nr:3-phosphoshikimate 1-carboxyvinyltransferase [Ruminococcus sp.]
MDIKITPRLLSGSVTVPASKSVAHRLVIAAALADGESVITNVYPSKDILATVEAMRALGAEILLEGDTARIKGITAPPAEAVIDCGESGSTLRFLIPAAAALGVRTTFIGHGKLPERPITPYLEELPRRGCKFEYAGTMPFTVSGRLEAGEYRIGGGISSQFITGMLLALSVIEGESRITLTSHLESKPYVDITSGCLGQFGCTVTEDGQGYTVTGSRALAPCSCAVEGDWSQAAFFEVANAIGSSIEINGLNVNSLQGDKKILEICREMVYNKNGVLRPFELDCSDIPDLVPVLAVLGCFCEGSSRLYNAGRLRIKESDRLAAVTETLNRIGGRITEYEDMLVIEGVGELEGGEIDAFNDHRIAMAAAVASTKCRAPLIIRGAGCVSKSYPDFWEVFRRLGGCFEEV